jgi:type II secretory pathway component PulK
MRRGILRGEGGVAMMMTLVAMLVLSVLAAEIVYESQVYSGIVFRQRDTLRAQLLARSGLRMALLQLKAAQKAKGKAESLGLKDADSLTDQIWQTPLILPPPEVPGLTEAQKGALAEFTRALGLEGSLSVTITSEGDRLSLNQMVWGSADQTGAPADGTNPPGSAAPKGGNPAPPASDEERQKAIQASRDGLIEVLNQLLDQKRLDDDTFRETHPNATGETLLTNLAAWMDPKTEFDGDNRNKHDYYRSYEPTPYSPKDAPLVSESELHMVKGFDDILTRIVAENFTTQTVKGVNINKASLALIRALFPELSIMEAERLIKRRSDEAEGGPFKKIEDFWTYLESLGDFSEAKERLSRNGVALTTTSNTSYRVLINAQSGSARKTWLASVGPLPPNLDPKPAPGGTQGGTRVDPGQTLDGSLEDLAKQQANQDKNKKAKNDSDSLHIIYLKAD